ncbi:MAG TPA: META domain-containing protein [Methylococcaceae bacterium]|nr:META domain-containing protein [Methylococcaceae bacterium]
MSAPHRQVLKTAAIRSHRYRLTTRVLAALALAVCTPVWAGTLQGTAAYRERIALPPDAVFEAVLPEVSRADAPAEVLGRAKIDPAGHPPFRFEIGYGDAAVQLGKRYTVRAIVSHQGRLLFATDRAYPVLGDNNAPLKMLLVSARAGKQPPPRPGEAGTIGLPASYEGELPGAGGPILWHLDLLPEGRYQLRTFYKDKPEPNRFDDIGRWSPEPDTGRLALRGGRETPVFFMPESDGGVLRKLDRAGKPITSAHNDRLQRLPQPALIEPRLALTGMFTYMADAAAITLCADDRKLPVATEADYQALEAAYLQARQQAGQALLVSLEGLIASRPSMEAGAPPRTSLVVERFITVSPRESCGNPLTDSPLRGTYWKLVRLGETPVQVAEPQREPHLIFAADQPRISGSGGCNRVMGSFELDGEKLRLGRMASTMMACPRGMEQEQQFLRSLETVERYRISGSHLEMLDGAGTLIARFEAVALR